MATTKKSDADSNTMSVQEANFDQARETARINHENEVQRNTVDGNEGVKVREGGPVEVINPVRNSATGELEDDTRTLKQTPEEALGVGLSGSAPAATVADGSESDSSDSKSTKSGSK